MGNERKVQPVNQAGDQVDAGYQPEVQELERRGYQPQVSRPLKLEELKPPKGGSAIQRPNSSAPKQP